MTFKVENISGVESVPYHGIQYQAALYEPYITELPKNPFKNIIEYDQKKDKSCVVFSDMAMISYNCNLTFTDEEWREMWLEHQWERGGDIFKTSRELGQRFILNSFPIYLNTHHWNIYLDLGWSAQIEVWCDPNWLTEWVHTGKITKILPIKNSFRHAMLIYKINGRYYLQNSWRWLKEEYWFYNIYDITEVYHECIKIGILRPYWMSILPYYSWLWKPTTLKDHTRALIRLGSSITWNIWEDFKKKFAKVDWKIDQNYMK